MRSIFSILFIVLALIVFFVVMNPIYKSVGLLKADVSSYKEALKNSNNLEEIRDRLLSSYRNIEQENIDKLDHLLPSSVNNIELVLEIEKIANDNGVFISDVKFGSSTDPLTQGNNGVVGDTSTIFNPLYGEYFIEFGVDGEYSQFNNFLKGLETNLRIIDIDSISFDTVENDQNANILNFKLKIKTYWLR